MERPLYAYTYAEVSFDDAVAVLTEDPERLLRLAAAGSDGHGAEIVGNLVADLGGIVVDRDVTIELAEVDRSEEHRAVLPLRWEATHGHAFYPTAAAQLEIAALSFHPPRVQVTLSGTYDPPFGVAGEVIDRAVAHRVAEAVAHRFVEEVTTRLEAAVRARRPAGV